MHSVYYLRTDGYLFHMEILSTTKQCHATEKRENNDCFTAKHISDSHDGISNLDTLCIQIH